MKSTIKKYIFLFSSGKTHIHNQIKFLNSSHESWIPIFFITNKEDRFVILNYWKIISTNMVPQIVWMPLAHLMSKLLLKLPRQRFILSISIKLFLFRLNKLYKYYSKEGEVNWSHGDPTHISFLYLSSYFCSKTPLWLVDDGAASRFFPKCRLGVHYPFFPYTLNPTRNNFVLSRKQIEQINFVTSYTNQIVVAKDKIIPAKISYNKLRLQPSQEIWIAGSNAINNNYFDYLKTLSEHFQLKSNRVIYLPHPKEKITSVIELQKKFSFEVPEVYKSFEEYLIKRAISPSTLITLPSTVIDTAIDLGIPASSIFMCKPVSSWLPYPKFYSELVNTFLTDYPDLQHIQFN